MKRRNFLKSKKYYCSYGVCLKVGISNLPQGLTTKQNRTILHEEL